MSRILLLTLDVCLLATAAYAQTRAPQELQVRETTTAIAVDGRLDDEAWQQALPITLAFEYFPGDNAVAPVETTCRVAYDRDRLYVGCRATDADVSALRANLADRDVPRDDDDTIGFMIDPFNDGRRAFEFRVNPRGVQMDAVYSDADDEDDWTWDAIWDAKTQILADGYSVEIAVPFSSLRFPRTAGVQTWGFVAMRDMPRSTRYRMRSAFVDRNRSCLVCQLDRLTGFEHITPGHSLEFDPTATFARTDRPTPFPGGRLVSGDPSAQAGLSARWSIRPNVIFSAMVNPDFYQVEADNAQLDVNTQFQLRFAERRPFFLEGADLFRTPFEAVFTRTVADPFGGVKLTGKEGPHAFGVFVAHDAVTGVLVPGFDSSSFAALDRANTSTVARYRGDIGSRGSTLGVLYTGRDASDYENHAAGIDGLIRMSDADSVRFQWLASQTRYPEGVARDAGQSTAAFAGQAVTANYAHGSRNWDWSGGATAISPEFRADAGFIPQVGTRVVTGDVTRKFIGAPERWFNEIDFSFGCDRTTDWSGDRGSWGCDPNTNYQGPMQMEISYNPAPNSEYYRGEHYSNFRHNLSWSMRPNGALQLFADLTKGGTIDFTNARGAQQVRFNVGTNYNLLGRLTGLIQHTQQTLWVNDHQRLFVARITQAQAVYHLTPRTFVRAILQYRDTMRDPVLYVAPTSARSRQFFSQWLFSYKVNPQTAVLAGYSDNALGTDSADLTRADRTLFLKVGYALLP